MGSIDFPEFINMFFFLKHKSREDEPEITLNNGNAKDNKK